MEKIIFLDYDGVFNSIYTLKSNNDNRLFWGKISKNNYEYKLKSLLSYFDFEKLQLLKKIVTYTNAKIITISAWQVADYYPLIEEYFTSIGLPMLSVSPTLSRPELIEDYLRTHNVKSFIILDDEKSFYIGNYEYLQNFLFKTDTFDDGLTEDIANEAIDFLLNNRAISFKELVTQQSRARVK